jgi:hypothetical protein
MGAEGRLHLTDVQAYTVAEVSTIRPQKSRLANFGKRHFIKFGSTRTLQELENSVRVSFTRSDCPGANHLALTD